MRIFLVRHGQTLFNAQKRVQGQKQVPLDKTGILQSRKVAKKFKTMKINAIYSSTLVRALQTAKEIAKYHKLKIKKMKWLSERNFGKHEGLSSEEIMQKYPDLAKQWKKQGIYYRPPEGETLKELYSRAIKNFKPFVKKQDPNATIIIVSHGGIIRCIVHHLHGGDPKDVFHTNAIENTGVVQLDYDKTDKRKFKMRIFS